MIRVGIVGATGYAGAELVRILSAHPEANITILTSRQYAGQPFSSAYPAYTGRVDLDLCDYDADQIAEQTDVVFTALPHKIPMSLIPELLERGVKVVDLSADFRFSDPTLYEAAYEPHLAPSLCEEAVYGLSEIYGEAVSRARLVGNPGCYPTCILLPLLPIAQRGWVDLNHVICDAKSGVSGAGRGVSLGTHFCEISQGFKAYKVGGHRHRPEIQAIVTKRCESSCRITFVPHLIPTIRGMLATQYLVPLTPHSESEIREAIQETYADRPFVRVLPEGQFPDIAHVRGTNLCDIGVRVDPETGTIILVSAIDNLVKGAAGQAVQNMNLMFQCKEDAGLTMVPAPV